jgi:hypothetical protein
MPGRLDLRPLIAGALDGLRKRRVQGDEPVDGPTRYILFGLPLAVGAVAVALRLQLADAGSVATACGVLIGALLSGFGALGAWKERLLARDRDTEQVDLRALNEAAAHILLSVIVAMGATVTLTLAANLTTKDPGTTRAWIVATCGGIGIGALVFLSISLVIVVNLLWDAYTSTTPQRRSHQSR